MLICPDCHKELMPSQAGAETQGHSSACAWQLEAMDGIPVYLSTRDKQDEMFKRYLANYKDISVDDLENSIQNEKYLKSQNDKLFSYLPSLTGLSVCEVGVGKGILLEHIVKTEPARLVGIDISIPYIKAIKSKLLDKVELLVANAENIPFANQFDVIIAADIIEHVFNIGDFLATVNRALKPGGRFIVKTPFNEDINGYSKLRGCKYDFVHLRNFNKKTLTTVLEGAGFEVDKLIFDGFYAYKRRACFDKVSSIAKRVDNYLLNRFPDIHDVNSISNFLGNILMDPIEITAVSTKQVDVLS